MNVVCSALTSTLKAMTVAASVIVTAPCPAYVSITAAPSGTTLDFSGAPMVRLDLAGLSGITVTGFASTDTPNYALYVINSNNISLVGPRATRPGISGVFVLLSDNVDVAAPWVSQSSADGIDVGESTHVSVHDGACENNVATTIHPDCVQGWSAAGYPLQHIKIYNMTATGRTQGFDVWDHTDFGATDIQIVNNHAAITRIACVGVINVHALVIKGNDCHSLSGNTSIVDVRSSPGAIIANNSTVPPSN